MTTSINKITESIITKLQDISLDKQQQILEYIESIASSLFDNLSLESIDKHSEKFKNLSLGCPNYGDFLKRLSDQGWIRFAVGFKSGVYCHPDNRKWCIKIMGMGIGDNPYYFCGRGYYLRHEKEMLLSFKNSGFDFQPNVMSDEDSISFLIENCGAVEEEARHLVENKDLLIIEYINGVTIATRTGYHLDYEVKLPTDEEVLRKTFIALHFLKQELTRANQKGLLHNDPMPDNIILTLDDSGTGNLRARLVDFEIAQDINPITYSSPNYVDNTVEELYQERDVPLNHQTHKYKKNLDQHLIDGSIELIKEFLDYITITKPLSRDYPEPDKASSLVFTGNLGCTFIVNNASNSMSVENVVNNVDYVALEIQQLIKQLEQSHLVNTKEEQRIVAEEAIKRIESDPTWKQRVINAAKEGGLAALEKTLEKTLDNPIGALITAAIKGWLEAKAE